MRGSGNRISFVLLKFLGWCADSGKWDESQADGPVGGRVLG